MIDMTVGDLDTPCGESLLFLCLYAPLYFLLQLDTTLKPCEIHSRAYSACFGGVRALGAKCFLFDSNAMCEVINLITTGTESGDTLARRKHPGLARIYGRAADNTPITCCECTQYPLA